MNKILYLFITFFILNFIYTPSINAVDWWNSSWNYKKMINITNQNDSEVLDVAHSINFSINTSVLVTAGKLRPDCNDLRIVYNNIAELDRMNTSSCNTSDTEIWFKLQANISAGGYNDTGYYMYYGYSSAGSPPTVCEKVFAFCDEFSGAAINTSKWEDDTGMAVVANGIMTFTPTGTNVLTGIALLAPPQVLWARNNRTANTWSSFGFITNPYAGGNRITMFRTNTLNYLTSDDAAEANIVTDIDDNTFSEKKIIWADARSRVNWYEDGTESLNSPYVTGANIPDESMSVMASRGTQPTSTDWIRVWNYIFPEPTTVLGSEEFNDVIPPDVNFVYPTPNNFSFITDNYTYINVSLSENPHTIYLEWNNTINYTMGNITPLIFYYNITGLNFGKYTYKVFANDSNNNTNWSETRTLTIYNSYLTPQSEIIIYNNISFYFICLLIILLYIYRLILIKMLI